MSFPLGTHCFVSSVTLPTLRQLGMESLEWDPEVLMEGFEDAFGLKKCPQKLFDKLNCGYMLLGTDMFYNSIEGFLSATAIMNDRVFDQETVPFCSLAECAWSVWEVSQLLGETKEGETTMEFSPDIVKYIQEAGRLNGVSSFPIWLSFANDDPHEYPDMAGDVSQFEMYMQRQQEYIQRLNKMVTAKQERLTAELKELEKLALVG
jgi:hypothetical protein